MEGNPPDPFRRLRGRHNPPRIPKLTVTQQRYQQVKSAFRLALEFPSEHRESFARQFCATDPDLLTEVLTLLRSDSQPATALDRPAVGTQFRLRAMSLSYTATRH